MMWRAWFFSAALAAASGIAAFAAAADPIADLKAAAALQSKSQHAAALAAFRPLAKTLPKLGDYVAWFTATSEFDLENYASVAKALEPLWAQSPPSPLVARSAMLGAQAYQKSGNAQDALDLLRKYYAALPQPAGDLAMAKAFAANGDAVSAAVYAQRVYYGYPASSEAAEADAVATTLRTQLNDAYPPAMGNVRLGRALKLLDAGQTRTARRELVALATQLGGPERDTAQVKIGVADYVAKDTRAARKYLTELTVESPQADAERIYYLLLCARRGDDRAGAANALEQLTRLHPDSS